MSIAIAPRYAASLGRSMLGALAIGALQPCAATAQSASAPVAQESPQLESPQLGPLGTLRTIDGRSVDGRLVVDATGQAVLTGDTGDVTLDVSEIRSFEQSGVEARPVDTEHRVWLRSGAELPVRKLAGRAATETSPPMLVVELPCRATVELPLSTVRAIRHGGTARPRPRLFPADLETPPANNDLIYVFKDGEAARTSVTVTGLTEDRIDFELRGDGYDFDLEGLAAVVFGANTGFAPDRQPRPRTTVEMVTGERIEGRLLSIGADVRCRLDEGAVVTVPAARMRSLQVASDRLVWLSELVPEVEQTPAFDRVWPWHVDRTIVGPGFDLAGRHYERGIGLVPRTRLTYDVGGRFDVFEAVIGIDDRGGPEAHAVFRVLADGNVVYESGPKTLGQRPETLRVPLQRAQTLAIEVDFGKNYDLGDVCAFADARVVQQ